MVKMSPRAAVFVADRSNSERTPYVRSPNLRKPLFFGIRMLFQIFSPVTPDCCASRDEMKPIVVSDVVPARLHEHPRRRISTRARHRKPHANQRERKKPSGRCPIPAAFTTHT
jgi:hypothetical protein